MDVLIIDDERDSREIIGYYLNQYFPDATIVGQADSVLSGIELITSSEFDVLFLDIQLKNETSFDILDKLDDFSFDIIFITAYDEYAIKAIKHNAMDYLLKPIDRKEFIESVNKARKKIKSSNVSESITELLNTVNETKKKQLKIPTLTGFKLVNTDDIIRLESEGSYTHLYLSSKETIMVSQNLKIYEGLLPSSSFCRIHNSHLVNINYIKEYIKGRGGQIILKDETVLSVSNHKKEQLLKIWK